MVTTITSFMRIHILSLLAFSIFQINAQNIQYKLIERESEGKKVRKDQFNVHINTEIKPDLVWFHAIEPNWTNVAGFIKDGEMNVLFRDSINDGLLRDHYIYENSGVNENYVVVSVRSFDDGPSEMQFFYISEQKSFLIGSLSVYLKRKNSDWLGDYSKLYAKEQLRISKNDGDFQLIFQEGYEYIYRHNYEEHTLKGPLKFKLTGNEFELVNK